MDPQRIWGGSGHKEQQSLMPGTRQVDLILPWGGRGAVAPLLLGQVVSEAARTEQGAGCGCRVSEMGLLIAPTGIWPRVSTLVERKRKEKEKKKKRKK